MSLKLSDKWKLEGFLESGREHIGKLIDQGNLFDFITNAGVAYFGYRAGERLSTEEDPPEVRATRSLGGLVTGLVGLRLATTMGGTPPLSQIAGLAILAGIGVINMNPIQAIQEEWEAAFGVKAQKAANEALNKFLEEHPNLQKHIREKEFR